MTKEPHKAVPHINFKNSLSPQVFNSIKYFNNSQNYGSPHYQLNRFIMGYAQ